MKSNLYLFTIAFVLSLLLFTSCQKTNNASITVPFKLDHNRMLVEAEFLKPNGSWYKTLIWVDSGNPEFLISEKLANELGIDLSEAKKNPEARNFLTEGPKGVKIGGKELNFSGIASKVMFAPRWLFYTMGIEANLPSTVLENYQIIFDYPANELTIADSGIFVPKGQLAEASLNRETGIIQIDADIAGKQLSFALDNGASYSFLDGEIYTSLLEENKEWKNIEGAVGCANMWGWWQSEQLWSVMRIPGFKWGSVQIEGLGAIGMYGIGEWYSQKTARPVNGFLGANALKAFRVTIDYPNSKIYFVKSADFDSNDLTMVGLTIRQEEDGTFTILGISSVNNEPAVEEVKQGDKLIMVNDFKTKGCTMGKAVDALRGNEGEIKRLTLERNGELFTVDAAVEKIL